jgi:hypothetical protein
MGASHPPMAYGLACLGAGNPGLFRAYLMCEIIGDSIGYSLAKLATGYVNLREVM